MIRKIMVISRNFLIAFVSIILFFLFAETLFTMAGFKPKAISKNVMPDKRFYTGQGAKVNLPVKKARWVQDPLLFWRLKPLPGEGNSAAFRSKKEFSINKQKGVYRIICLGDSVTYGAWVKTEEVYPYILEQMLNVSSDYPKFEVINAGVMGYSSLQGLRQLKRDLLKYKPDLITVLFGFDDNYPAVVYSDKEQKIYNKYIFSLENALKKSRFYLFLKVNFYKMKGRFALNRNNLSQRAHGNIKRRVEPEDYRINLQEMATIAKENNTKILFLTPVLFRLRAKEVFYLNDYAAVIPQEYVLDLLTEFKRYQDKTDLFLDGCHFTPPGHWIVAKAIYDTLVKKKIVNPKQGIVNIPIPAYPKGSLPEEIKERNLNNYINMGENEIGALTFGWHDLEKIGDRYARFIGGYHATAFLRNNSLEAEDKRLRVEMFSYISNKVLIFINDNYAATVECLPNVWQEAEVEFKDDAKFLKISIDPQRIFKPSIEFGSQDDRNLSVAISKIEVVEYKHSLNKT